MISIGRYRSVVCAIISAAFVAMGVTHFICQAKFARIVPPFLPQPMLLVAISGICEITGGISLQLPPLRKPAAWGLIALLIAVFPANIFMAVAPEKFTDLGLPAWFWWVRLPFQPIFIAIVWWVGLRQIHVPNETPSRL